MRPLVRFPFLILTLAALSGMIIMAGNGTARAASMESELMKLLQTHPQILEAEKQVEAAREAIDEARSGYLPDVNMTGDFGPEVVDSPSERESGDGEIETRSRSNATLNVTQSLFDGFSTSSNVRAARMRVDSARKNLARVRQNQAFEGVKAYLDVIRESQLVRLAQENEERILQLLDLEDERVTRGAGITLDVLTAKQRLQRAKERRVNFSGEFEKALASYIRVFDRAPEIPNMVEPIPPLDALPTALEEALAIARAENPSIRQSAADVEVAREGRTGAASGFYPSLNLVGELGYEKHNNATVGTRRDAFVVLEFDWDLYSGGETRAGYKRSQYDYAATKDSHKDTHRTVAQLTAVAWHELLTTTERVDLLSNAVNLAAEVLSGRQRLREAGKETVINVLDAESELNDARINLTQARYDKLRSTYDLLLAMGRLSPRYLNLRELSRRSLEDNPNWDNRNGAGDPFAGTPAGRDGAAPVVEPAALGEPSAPAPAPVSPVERAPAPAPEPASQPAAGQPLDALDDTPSVLDSLGSDDLGSDDLFSLPPEDEGPAPAPAQQPVRPSAPADSSSLDALDQSPSLLDGLTNDDAPSDDLFGSPDAPDPGLAVPAQPGDQSRLASPRQSASLSPDVIRPTVPRDAYRLSAQTPPRKPRQSQRQPEEPAAVEIQSNDAVVTLPNLPDLPPIPIAEGDTDTGLLPQARPYAPLPMADGTDGPIYGVESPDGRPGTDPALSATKRFQPAPRRSSGR
ncbi:MAG: TolC family outer membrane protein [Magnetovibrionaceae bacterium]